MTFFTPDYPSFKENTINGRYVTHKHITPLLAQLNGIFERTQIGKSVQRNPIESITFGKGKRKILMWSQMHGNESTTTKAVFDLFNFISTGTGVAKEILSECRIKIIPILNPDGAIAYTRVNANAIDLNRDAQDLSQPESKILRRVYDEFQPDFCFNLHDQRTMYSVGAQSATVSFLAPSMDAQRSVSATRGESMQLIVALDQQLQGLIPGQVGRYDDGFNENCVGDTFQMLGTPTVLFEAGHYQEDYQREKTRECIFIALKTALAVLANDRITSFSREGYFKIPENGKRFFDILIKNIHCLNTDYDKGVHMGIRYEESLLGNTIKFNPKLESVFGNEDYLGHKSFDCSVQTDVAQLQKQTFFQSILGLS